MFHINQSIPTFPCRWFCILLFPLIIIFNPGLSGAAPDEKAKLESAKKEGKLVFYSVINLSDSMKLLDAFKKKYPFIKTQIYRSNSEKLLNKILIEARSKKYDSDVFLNNANITHILEKKALLAKYQSPQNKYYADHFKHPQGYWTSCFVVTRVMAYNTRLIEPGEAPKSYQDLLDPKWKGKIGGHTEEDAWFPAQLKIMGREQGIAFMKKLAEQDISHRTGRTLLGQLLAAGEFPLVLVANAHTIEKMKRQGAPVEWLPIEPVVTTLMPITLAAHAPHPNAGKLFVDFILSQEGQMIFKNVNRIPTRDDVPPDPPRLLKGLKLFPDDPELLAHMDEYRRLYRDIFLKK